jgi:hypothetical protein
MRPAEIPSLPWIVSPWPSPCCCTRRGGARWLLVFLAWALVANPAVGLAATKKEAARQEQEADLRQLIDQHFAEWDANRDGVVDLSEVNKKIENRHVRGAEAALLVAIYRQLSGKGNQPHATRAELFALAGERGFQRAFETATKKLQTVDRHLFLPADPDLTSFHQGRLSDCFLLSTIAAAVHRNPQTIRDMIHPAKNDGFDVAFGDGRKVHVAAITDAELLLGARTDGTHGIWLTVLEKAYGIIREREQIKKNGRPADPKAVVPHELLSTGGNTGPVISLLTGHEAGWASLKDKPMAEQQLHQLLADVTRKRRLACCGTAKAVKLPPGVNEGHAYAVFGYDGARRHVKVFNPHGNEFTPKGPPGLANGFATTHGVFTLSLDEFRKVFKGLHYETAKLLPK